nr:uncharacterized protein K02A2.6-like [Rhipicephalus microplus]
MATYGLPPLPPFLETPGDATIPWEQWRDDFTNFLEATGMDAQPPPRKKAILLQCLGVEGRRIFRTLGPEPARTPGTTEDKTEASGRDSYIEALGLLERQFSSTVNVLVERRRFTLRRQLPNEPIREFVSNLRQLAKTCDFGDFLEAALRDRVVDGIRSTELRQKLLVKGSQLTLAEAVEMLQTYEQAAEGAAVYDQGSPQTDIVQHVFQGRGPDGDSTATSVRKCYRCGSTRHLANSQECRARGKRCSKCHKRGHFQAVCGMRREQNVRTVRNDGASEEGVLTVLAVRQVERRTLVVDVVVENEPLQLLVDTGSSVSILPDHVYRDKFANRFPLTAATATLRDFSQKKIPVLGWFTARVVRGKNSACLRFYVVPQGVALLGLDAVHQLQLNIIGSTLECLQVTASPQSLPSELCEFSFLFADKLGLAKNFVHSVKLRADIKPVAAKVRRLPLTLRDKVAAELTRLLDAGIIERVSAAEWVSPIVVVQKKDGTIRLCVDLREPNKAVVIDGFPLPHTEELLHALSGAAWFSKLDLAAAYHQVELAEESREITTFITHEGLFRFCRVCFGLASAPAAFQRMMQEILKGCKGVLFYIDDIIVFGKTKHEHNRNLREVLHRIAEAGLQLNQKCLFAVKELSFLGHHVSARGLAPLKSKVDAVMKAQTPADVVSLRSFLGLIGYYSHFLPNYAEVVEPLRRLLRKGQKFVWDQSTEESFCRVKKMLSSCGVVAMFNESLPVQVTTDASAYGLGAVLQQVVDGEVRTVAFASRTLTPPERKYSTGEREALACLWACEHWHVYLWGRKFVLRTDHQALVTLLSTNGVGRRPLRIERWSARLLRYNFTVQYTKGSTNVVADALSRLPLTPAEDDPVEEVVAVVSSMITKSELQAATAEDSVLNEVAQYVMSRWPEKGCLAENIKLFFRMQEELSVIDGLLFRAERVVPPAALASRLVMMAHESHPGIVRTKQRLREQYWWPGMDSDVESLVRNCAVCKASDKSAKTVRAPLEPVQWPEKPWEKLGIDIVGPMERAPPECRFAITIIDYHSKWPEVAFVSTITAQAVVKVLVEIFSREGYPKSIVTDNGRQFMSTCFEQFLRDRGIQHCVTTLYYPQCNGQIERFNRVLKEYMQVAALERRPLKEAIWDYLGVYRATPHATTGASPAYLLHGRKPRTRLDVVGLPEREFFEEPRVVMEKLKQRVKEQQQRTKKYVDEKRGARASVIEPGDFVKVKQGGPKTKHKFSLPIQVKRRVGTNSFLLANGTKWNASKLTVISKGRTGQAQALADAVTARRNASSGFSYDMDLHIGKMAQPQNPIVVNESEVGPSEDTQGSANHSDSAQTTVTEPILEVPDQQDTSRSQLATATAPSRTRPERTRRMPTRYQDYELT